jgi:hypothetical protein
MRRMIGTTGATLALAAVAALACATLLLGIGTGALPSGSGSESVPFKTEAAPQRTSAQLKLDGDRATLVANQLPAPPRGKVYMVWLKRPGQEAPEPTAALFTPRSDGTRTALLTGLGDSEAVLVTDEPRSGSDTPTGKLLMAARLS